MKPPRKSENNSNMKLRYLTHTLACALLLTGLPSCSDKDPGGMESDLPAKLALSVQGTASAHTRTAIADPDDLTLKGLQHVTRVQLYIYEEQGNDFVCIASENVQWTHWKGAMQGLQTQQQGYTTRYQEYKLDSRYRFVAMGFDDTYQGNPDTPVFDDANSVKTYGKPDGQALVGDKLTQGIFKLQTGAGPGDIRQSELFAGAQTFSGSQIKHGEASRRPIELNRRVAGVLGYFRNLPQMIGNSEVKRVILRLYTPQNTKVPFLPKLPDGYHYPKDVPDGLYSDHEPSPYPDESGRTIAEYSPVTIPAQNEFILSAYVLPITSPTSKDVCTLELAIQDAQGKDLAVHRVLCQQNPNGHPARNGTGIIGDPKDPRGQYPLRANHFYRIGSQKDRIDLSGAESEILIYLDPVWDEYYGGTMEGELDGMGIDKEWGSQDGGSLDKQ